MKSEIQIKNSAGVCRIEIEGTIGVPEEWQFDQPEARVATYEKFRDTVRRIAGIDAPQIVVDIRSTGGDVNDALLIHDALCSLDAHITTRCYGYTASAATIIAQAASPGCREISANALYLIHNSICTAEGNAEELATRIDLLRKTDARLAEVYAARSGRTPEEFTLLMAENNGSGRWLSPQEALAAGLVDRIIEPAATEKTPAAGWSGGAGSKKLQKTIPLNRVKAELGYSAADYFSLVYELITNRPEVNMEDLTGTELEEAETTLFKQAIAESIRSTMWVGDTSAESGANTFDGFLKTIATYSNNNKVYTYNYETDAMNTPANSVAMFDDLWKNADERLKDLKAEGQLAFFVSSDVYSAYEKHLDSMSTDGAYTDYINGRQNLLYHGIPVVDLRISSYLAKLSSSSPVPKSFCILTDRRNLVLAVNTADFPGNEIRMWYNPDEMENRQRAVFMAGCDVLDEGLVAFASRI